ncbi:MAG: prepilin-type N-terminal cleavage/methylation domain-containing protein [bacterium]|nr:prepilin-type N-terminal cleavage/methylation domain-containing protein [bacterium]
MGFMTKFNNNHNRYGFTAAEIVTVVAIVAILALIAIPIYWKKTEETKITAARDEMQQIGKAESLAYAETGYFVFPSNLMQVPQSPYATVTVWSYDTWLAAGQWSNYSTGYFVNGDPMQPVLANVGDAWKGPYLQYQKFDTTLNLPLDPWGKPYRVYGSQDTAYNIPAGVIWSSGPNYVFESDSTAPWGPPVGDDIMLKF